MTEQDIITVPQSVVGKLVTTLENDQQRHIETLKRLVDIPCGSEMVEGVQKVNEIIEQRLQALGMTVRRHSARGFGDHLVATNGMAGKQIVLGGHTDTTYTDYTRLPAFTINGEYAIGPGTSDMKGGIVVMLAALESLKAAGLMDGLAITVVLNSDEERAATTSRPLFKPLARNTEFALYFECGGPNGEVVVSRRAKLAYQLDVQGVPFHAGLLQSFKTSALEELSHKIIAVEGLNKKYPGTAFNVGRAWGGEARNTVPSSATALVDIWFWDPVSERAIKEDMEQISAIPTVSGAQKSLKVTSFRPAWPENEGTGYLLDRIQSVAAALKQNVQKERRTGTADSSWFGSSGVPTLDGLGPIGFDDHTPQERLYLPSLIQRSMLTATLLATYVSYERTN